MSDETATSELGVDPLAWAKALRAAIMADAGRELERSGGCTDRPWPTLAYVLAITSEPGQVLHTWLSDFAAAVRADDRRSGVTGN